MNNELDIIGTKNLESDEVTMKEIGLNLKNWLNLIFFNWRLLIFGIFLGGVLGLLASVLTKPIFTAELSFVIDDDRTGGLGGAAGLASQFGLNFGGSSSSAFSGDNLLELMKSRAIVQKTLLCSIGPNNESLAELFIFSYGFQNKWKSELNLSTLKFPTNAPPEKLSRKQDSILSVLYKFIIKENLKVDKIDKKLSFVLVKVASNNEFFSKKFAEVLVKNVSDFYIETKTKKESNNFRILQKQSDSVRKELNQSISGLANALDINPNINPNMQKLTAPSHKKQIDVQVNTAVLIELEKNLEISKISLRKETPLFQVIDQPLMPLEKTVLSKPKGILFGSIISLFFTIIYISMTEFWKQKNV